MKRKKILFVCTGNTCRSPMAEFILRSKIKKRKIRWWDVTSRGLNADGGAMSANSRKVLAELGISCEGFKSRQLDQKSVESSAIVITMTTMQKQMLEGCGKIYCMRDFCGFDIPDPYGGSEDVYRATREAISRACDAIIEKYILREGN